MKTFELLPIVWPGVVAGVAAAALCGPLSVLVAARKMALMTQGVSHAAMAGAGVAAIIGASGQGASAVVGGACLVAALVIGIISARGKTTADTAVGVVLVASMALGAILLAWRLDHPLPGVARPPSWESLLFGSILTVRANDAFVAIGVAIVGFGALWLARRALVLTTLDPVAARASGAGVVWPTILLAMLVGGGVVIAVKLVGVVLATALLVLPGAGALRMRAGLRGVFGFSTVVGIGGVLVGLLISFETDAPPGAACALTLTVMWLAATLAGRFMVSRTAGSAS